MNRFCRNIIILSCLALASATIGLPNHVEAKRGSTPVKMCKHSHACHYIIESEGVTYNVTGKAVYWRKCGTKATWPAWGCDLIQAEILDRIGPSNLAMTWALSCGNTHSYTASIISTPGVCGSADGVEAGVFPTTGLCSVGAVVATSTTNYSFDWSCASSGGVVDTSCSAPKQSGFDLACQADPETGTEGEPINFTASISGTTTPSTSFDFLWYVNGTDYADDSTFSHTFTEATTSVSVKVRATLDNSIAREITCPVSRIDCGSNQSYCGDVPNSTSYQCVNNVSNCPSSACGTGYDIALDKELSAGGSLPVSDPGSSYLTTNGLCAAGSQLKYVAGISSWQFSAGYSTWRWDCQNTDANNVAVCKARCATGEYYCVSAGHCVSEADSCDCTLAGSEDEESPTFVDQRLYCIDDRTNTCFACGEVIRYFILSPDEVQKDEQCHAYWESIDVTEDSKPASTTATRVTCSIASGSNTVEVSANNPQGSDPYELPVGSHELTCTQQYQLEDDLTWYDLLSSSIPAKCRSLPGIIEH